MFKSIILILALILPASASEAASRIFTERTNSNEVSNCGWFLSSDGCMREQWRIRLHRVRKPAHHRKAPKVFGANDSVLPAPGLSSRSPERQPLLTTLQNDVWSMALQQCWRDYETF